MKPWERSYTNSYASEPAMKGEVAAKQDTASARAREIAATRADIDKVTDPQSKAALQGHLQELQRQETTYGGQPQAAAPAAAPKPWERRYAAAAPASAPAPEPRGFTGGVARGARQLAAGFADVGNMIAAPVDFLMDAGRAAATGKWTSQNKQRREAFDEFANQGEAPGVIDSLTRSAPEMVMTGGPLAKVETTVAKEVAGRALPKVVQKLAPAAADVAANTAQSVAGAAARGEDLSDAAKWGAAGSVGGRAVAKVLNKSASGVSRALRAPEMAPEARVLLNEGIQPTPGQAYGGAIERVEEAMKNVPFTGRAVEQAQGAVHEGVYRQAIDEALSPLGVTVQGKGISALNAAKEAVDSAYEAVVPRTFANTNDVHAAFTTVRQLMDDGAIPLLGRKEQRLFGAYMDNKLVDLMDNVGHGQHIDGRTLRDLDIDLGKMERQYAKKDPALGEAFRTLKQNIRGAYMGQDDDAIAALGRANQAFRNMLPVRDALEKSLTSGGTPTPIQLRKALGKHGQTPSAAIDAAGDLTPNIARHGVQRGILGTTLSTLGALAHPGLAAAGLAAGYIGSKAYSPAGIRAQMAAIQRANRLGQGLSNVRVSPQIASQIGREMAD